MAKMVALLNHKMTEAQKADAQVRYGITDFIELNMPAWSQVPADACENDHARYGYQFMDAITAVAGRGDYLFIQGEMGLTHQIVNTMEDFGIISVYATTTRESVEVANADGSTTKTNVFKHVRFRKYH